MRIPLIILVVFAIIITALLLKVVFSSTGVVNVSDSAFPNPEMRHAAQLLLQGNADEAIQIASTQSEGINAVSPEGDTLLHLAIKENDPVSVKKLLGAGANPNIPLKRAPIAAAVELANTEVVNLLLEAGADPDGTTNGESALWRAALGGRQDVVELLLKHGAKIDYGDVDGETPALAAVLASQFSMALFLLEHGASPFAKSYEGMTIAEWAAESHINPNSEEGRAREELYEVLRKAGAM